MMEAVSTFETTIKLYQITRRNILLDTVIFMLSLSLWFAYDYRVACDIVFYLC